MRLSKHQTAVLALIIANVIWGASFPIYKWALTSVKPFTFVFLRFFLGAIVLFPFVFRNLKIAKVDIGKIIFASFAGITFCISFLFLGLQIAPSINASIILSTSPILLILAALFYLHEKIKKKIIIGTIISLFGVLIITLRPIVEHGLNHTILGNFFFILTAIGGIIHIIILEKIMKRYSSLTIAFWTFVIGIIPLLPFVIIEAQQSNILNLFNIQGIIGITYGFLFASAIAHSLLAYGIKYIKTSEVGIFGYVDPLATVIVAIPLLQETITLYYIIGAVFVFGGIYIAEGRIPYHPFHLLKEGKN